LTKKAALDILYSINIRNNRTLQTEKDNLAVEIRKYKQRYGYNYEQLAEHMKVCKTTLYRAATGNWQRPTAKLNAIARKFEIELVSRRDGSECRPVLEVINEIWDGSDEHAVKLARLMRDVHELAYRYR
jgi:transcriptional regulator with XRE-family HTH domain|tara:strand:- start:2355 stop:2741 length:387 start_codon:yes stop_codon:yes gene_type:complete